MLNIFSCVFRPSVCLLWRIVCLDLVPIFDGVVCFCGIALQEVFINFGSSSLVSYFAFGKILKLFFHITYSRPTPPNPCLHLTLVVAPVGSWRLHLCLHPPSEAMSSAGSAFVKGSSSTTHSIFPSSGILLHRGGTLTSPQPSPLAISTREDLETCGLSCLSALPALPRSLRCP